MSATSFSRSRSPVLSIRTQPEDEHALRAQIAAANRTQHEILPRYSWHQGLSKKVHTNSLRQTARILAHRNIPLNQVSRSITAVNATDYDEDFLPVTQGYNEKSTLLSPTTRAKQPWKQLSRQKTRDARSKSGSNMTIEPGDGAPVPARLPMARSAQARDGTNLDGGHIAPYKVSDAQMHETFEERNAIADLSNFPTQKSKSTIRKSVYGSLSSTKSFFRSASKAPLKRLRSQASSDAHSTPHLYSFENKDQLREYLNDASIVSPLSPTDNSYRILDISGDKEPAELSAGPLPAELEGNGPHIESNQPSHLHSISNPSVRDLPPYVDDEQFCSDMVKEQSRSSEYNSSEMPEKAAAFGTESFTCSSCNRVIGTHEIHDFCSICDNGDRILCIRCAERGPCCQHELEQLLRHGPTDQSMRRSRRSPERADACTETEKVANGPSRAGGSSDYRDLDGQTRCLPLQASSGTELAREKLSKREDISLDNLALDVKALQLGLLTEMGYLRREQDLMHRERELTLRSREIDMKSYEYTLREREVMIQRNTEAVNRNMETLLACRELATGVPAGSQLDSTQSLSIDGKASRFSSLLDVRAAPMTKSKTGHHDRPYTYSNGVSEAITNVELSILDRGSNDSHIKSYAAQKRKKTTGNNSADSTPAANSSPGQSRTSLSRGNSERDASQDDGDEDGDEGRRSPKKNKQECSTQDTPAVLFACPYAKHDPQRFSSRNIREKNYRGCATHYLPDVSRLKQHLRRVHWQPELFCPRCYEEFNDSARLVEHAGSRVACCSKTCPFPEKMDRTKQEKIHVKRPRVPQDVLWYDIYKVLFPGSPVPETPYMDGEDRIATPISATPQSSTNLRATQTLSNIFSDRLDQHEDLRNHPSRTFIDKTLIEAFTEFLTVFSLSPAASPGAGPSIVVSPVSQSLSDNIQLPESVPSNTSRPGLERHPSITDIITQPQQVPRLQQPRPPRPKLKTALEVPRDHHRSLSGQHQRSESTGSSSPADVVFDINILSHIHNDQGYGEECLSFEQGDDLQAMAFVNEPSPPACRNKSVMSIDSGYGSSKSQQHSTFQQIPQSIPAKEVYQSRSFVNDEASFQNQQLQVTNRHTPSVQAGPNLGLFGLTERQGILDEHSAGNFQSYSNYLDPIFQDDIVNGIDYQLSYQCNPWSSS